MWESTYVVRQTFDWFEWVMSYMWMSHASYMNESSLTYERVMSHIWMSHVTHINCRWTKRIMWESTQRYIGQPWWGTPKPYRFYTYLTLYTIHFESYEALYIWGLRHSNAAPRNLTGLIRTYHYIRYIMNHIWCIVHMRHGAALMGHPESVQGWYTQPIDCIWSVIQSRSTISNPWVFFQRNVAKET